MAGKNKEDIEDKARTGQGRDIAVQELQDKQETELSMDAAFAQLASIVEQMDAPEVSLEESLKLYKQGVGILKQCNSRLSDIEKEMILLTEEGEMPDGDETAY